MTGVQPPEYHAGIAIDQATTKEAVLHLCGADPWDWYGLPSIPG